MTLPHPSHDDLFLYQADLIAPQDLARVEQHLLICSLCRDTVDSIQKEHPEAGALDLFAIGRLKGPIGNGIRLHLERCTWCSGTLKTRSKKVSEIRESLHTLMGPDAPAPAKPGPRPVEIPAAAPAAQPLRAFSLYELGGRLAAVSNLAAGSGSADTFQILSDAYDALHDFLEQKENPFPTATPVAHDLSQSLREAMVQNSLQSFGNVSSLNPEPLRLAIRSFQAALENDLTPRSAPAHPSVAQPAVAQPAPPPERQFPAPMWSSLPPAGRHHWTEATRCLAYGLSTATAFHALRTLESVVNLSLDRAGVPPQTRSLEDGLHMRRDHGGSPKVVDLALHLTSNYCNPLQWADCFVSTDEAADQFDLCSVAIKAFLRDMKATNQ